ncbi:hypothetical protein ACELLULO517_15785 [Acidisoma cellulosilytica]|uniref:Uncharacterized protein n=1 Tax=Acidisoma cellulosilyticum TaxID=2802395 RepID=A0A963Z3A8_9PROT|nr:hypothetical protein [Acidisoma cellulosilyticum]MCB8881709.1 hypothetical protein [Acidisoma cellulosilyticum]
MPKISIAQAISRFTEIGLRVHQNNVRALDKGASIIQKEAKSSLGHYQDGWPELAESTKDERERQGFPADEPLERDGILKKNIKRQVDVESMSASVGVPSKMVEHSYAMKAVDIATIAKAHEHGTDRIPPRPFLGPAAHRKGDAVAKVVGQATKYAIKNHQYPRTPEDADLD